MTPREACPQCGSRWDKRNGHIDTGKQNHRGKVCGRAFVLNLQNSVIIEEQRVLIERLLSQALRLLPQSARLGCHHRLGYAQYSYTCIRSDPQRRGNIELHYLC